MPPTIKIGRKLNPKSPGITKDKKPPQLGFKTFSEFIAKINTLPILKTKKDNKATFQLYSSKNFFVLTILLHTEITNTSFNLWNGNN